MEILNNYFSAAVVALAIYLLTKGSKRKRIKNAAITGFVAYASGLEITTGGISFGDSPLFGRPNPYRAPQVYGGMGRTLNFG